MDLSLLTYFVAVADEMNFSSAAEDLFLSQSALSKRIKKFENDLGVCLFNRDSHNVRLTPAGEALLPYARRIAIETETIRNYMQNTADSHDILRIGAFSLMSHYHLDRFFASFIKAHPSINLSLTEIERETLLKYLSSNQIDGCILYDYGSFSQEDYTILPLCTERLMAVMRPKHPLAWRKSVCMKDLEPYTILMPAKRSEVSCLDILDLNSEQLSLKAIPTNVWFSNLDEALGFHEDYVSVLPEKIAQYYGLHCIPINDAKPFQLSLIFRNDAVLPSFPLFYREISDFVSSQYPSGSIE